jgi:glutathione S-transferase
VNPRRAAAASTLAALDRHLRSCDYLANDSYSIADTAVFAYSHRAEEGGCDLTSYRSFRAWVERVASRPEGLPPVIPYSADPHSVREL